MQREDSRPRRAKNDDIAENNNLCYGKNAVTELLNSGADVDTVYVLETMVQAQASYFTALAKQSGAVIKRVHATKLNNMCGTDNHQGVAAYGACCKYTGLEELLQVAKDKGEPPFLLLADGIEDPHNLGAIIRTALLCGAHGVVIPRRGGVGVTPIVIKSSAGAAAHLPIARVANIGETVRKLKAQNVFVYCADMQGYSPFKQNLTGGIALVVGSEGKGVSHLVKQLCDGSLSLPMAENATGVDSFNVSVATGILMYEIMRQRNV